MSNKHFIIPDQHAHPDHDNKRAEWIGKLIFESKPDVVINLGDGADMPSLSSYDRGTRSFEGRRYQKDIDAHLDFQDKLWHLYRKHKKKRPFSVYLIGNHEERINKATNLSPELEGTLSLKDLQLDRWYHEVVEYDGGTPGVTECDGVCYSHYLTSGVMGRPVGGENPATALLLKKFKSCTVGHSHVLDYSVRTKADGKKIMGLVAGNITGYKPSWAGNVRDLWWDGVIIKHRVEDGCYDLRTITYDE